MAKHFGDASLIQLLTLVKEKIDTLLNKIEAKQEPFIVTATADMVNGVLTNVSHTFAQILEAYKRGDHIILEVDISQLVPGQKTLFNLSNYKDDSRVFFENVVRMSLQDDSILFIRGMIHSDNSNSFNILTFKFTSSVPTVDDRSVITFVTEG